MIKISSHASAGPAVVSDRRHDLTHAPHDSFSSPHHVTAPTNTSSGHGGHSGHDKHAGHDHEMFRKRFWLSFALTIPLVVTSEMVTDWFGYHIEFAGMAWLGPVLGSFAFFWGGWPFLAGGIAEIRDREPGMMLLISMAIIVAYGASLATVSDGSIWSSGGSSLRS